MISIKLIIHKLNTKLVHFSKVRTPKTLILLIYYTVTVHFFRNKTAILEIFKFITAVVEPQNMFLAF